MLAKLALCAVWLVLIFVCFALYSYAGLMICGLRAYLRFVTMFEGVLRVFRLWV